MKRKNKHITLVTTSRALPRPNPPGHGQGKGEHTGYPCRSPHKYTQPCNVTPHSTQEIEIGAHTLPPERYRNTQIPSTMTTQHL